MGDAFVARPSPLRLALLLSIGLGLVLLAAWIAGAFGPAPRPGARWIGWIGIAFFGVCTAVAARRLFDRGDEIVVDRRGIYWRRWSPSVIPWTDVRSIDFLAMGSQRFACVHLHDPARHRPKGVAAGLGALNKRAGFGDLALSTIGTDRRFEELAAALDHYGAAFADESATKMS